MSFPDEGTDRDRIFDEMKALRSSDSDWENGRTWSLVYHAGEDVEELWNDAYTLFAAENALNPLAFPSLLQFENGVTGMCADLMRGEDAVGNMTSGGTESIMMAVYSAREHARNERGIDSPEIVMPETAHPAWAKAAHYFSLDVKQVSVRDDWRADVNKVREAVSSDTALVVASAPSYPHGVVDPVEEMAKIADENGALCHVDSCIGGFMLPFVRELGYDVPEFDFSVPGVTSISLDPHKYGYAAKGASVLLYRDRNIRRHQYYSYDDWPGGIYATPNMQGTRPGGPIAATWAVMKYLGKEGYLELAERVMETTERLVKEINSIDELSVVSDPDMSIFAVESVREEVNMWAVHEELANRNWEIERQQEPPSIHLSVMYTHEPVVDEFVEDLRECVEIARETDEGEEKAPMYGLSAEMTRDEDAKEVVLDMMNTIFE